MPSKSRILSVEEKLALIESVANGGEIIADEGQLRWLLENRAPYSIIAYDGFEPSGQIHIAQALLRSININKFIQAGVKFVMLVADWHAAANHKFGGKLDIIKKVGDFFVEMWKVCGIDLTHVEFVYASEIIKDPKYWELVLKISINTSLNRVMRCTQIMGRSEKDTLQSSQILYPLMQCTDIFTLKADICQLGLDQRKVNMLAREVATNLGYRHKPIAVHHHMLMGLNKPPEGDMDEIDKKIAMKMSKSNPDSAIFMLDSKADIKRKIMKAWCPPSEAQDNPILEYCKYILFEKFEELEIKRPTQYGGDVKYGSYLELESAYTNGSLSPLDLKNAVMEYLDRLIAPVRTHFETDPKAKALAEFVIKEIKKSSTAVKKK